MSGEQRKKERNNGSSRNNKQTNINNFQNIMSSNDNDNINYVAAKGDKNVVSQTTPEDNDHEKRSGDQPIVQVMSSTYNDSDIGSDGKVEGNDGGKPKGGQVNHQETPTNKNSGDIGDNGDEKLVAKATPSPGKDDEEDYYDHPLIQQMIANNEDDDSSSDSTVKEKATEEESVQEMKSDDEGDDSSCDGKVGVVSKTKESTETDEEEKVTKEESVVEKATDEKGDWQKTGLKTKKYDLQEKTIVPVTIRMVLTAESQKDVGTEENVYVQEQLALRDGRRPHFVKFIGAIRSQAQTGSYSSNITVITYKIEDGSGLTTVKRFIDNNNANQGIYDDVEGSKDHTYVMVIGRMKEAEKYVHHNHIVAVCVRPVKDFNQFTHHQLEAVYSAEKYKKEQLREQQQQQEKIKKEK